MFHFILDFFVHCGSSKCLYALPAPLKLNRPILEVFLWDEGKPKKLFVLVQRMPPLECVHFVKQLEKYSSLAHLDKREQNARNVVKNLNYSSKS